MDVQQQPNTGSERLSQELLDASGLLQCSRIPKRRALLEWLREQQHLQQQQQQEQQQQQQQQTPHERLECQPGENVSDAAEDCDYLADLDPEDDGSAMTISDTETTVSAFSEEEEQAFRELQEYKEVVEQANAFNKYFTTFINRWNNQVS